MCDAFWPKPTAEVCREDGRNYENGDGVTVSGASAVNSVPGLRRQPSSVTLNTIEAITRRMLV